MIPGGNEADSADPVSLSASQSEEVDRLCDRFEAAWRAGERRRAVDHLGESQGAFRVALYKELLAVETEWRKRCGETPRPADPDVRVSRQSEANSPTIDPTEPLSVASESPNCDREISQNAPDAPRRDRDDASAAAPISNGPRLVSPQLDQTLLDVVGTAPGGRLDGPETENPTWQAAVTPNSDAATLELDHNDRAGATFRPGYIPGYDVLDELGRGGMGVVYKARQLNLNRIVALKMILAGSHATSAATTRFLQEAETIARLKHPHVVQVYDYGSHEGKPYFSLEYLEGGSLADRLKGEPQPPAPVSAMVQALAQAVQAAHEQGIVHRDLKPANVLLAADGTPKIADFGVAKQGDSVMTMTGEVLGTPSYMAPEQAEGHTKSVGPAADIYALGAILYELLTGRPPFKGASAWETIQLVSTSEPISPRQLQPRLPLDLETICLKCLEKDPAKRYSRAADLGEDLRRFQAGQPIVARPVGWPERTWRWCLRNRPVAASLAAVALSLLAATLVSAVFAIRADRSRQAEAGRAVSESKAKQEADQARRGAQRQLIELSAETGLTAAREGDHPLALLWFSRAVELAGDFPELESLNRIRYANWLRHVWTPKGTFTIPNFRRGQDQFRGLRFSPDGRYVFATATVGDYRVWDVLQKRPVPLPRSVVHGLAAAWEPDSGLLAVGGKEGKVRLLAPPTFRIVEEINADGEVNVLAFTRFGRRVAWGGPKGARVWDREKKAYATPFLPHNGQVVTVSFSKSGSLLATSARDMKARVFQVASERSDPVFPAVPHVLAEYGINHGGPDRVAPRFIDQDRAFLTVEKFGPGYNLVWRSSATGEIVGRSAPPVLHEAEYLAAFDVNLDGDRVASAWAVLGRLLDAHSQGIIAAIPTTAENWCEDVVFSADGETVVTCGNNMKVQTWSVRDQRDLNLSLSSPSILHPQQAVRVDLSRDGRHLAVALWDGTVCLWRSAQGPPVAYELDAGGATWPALSPDGRYLLPRGTSFRGGALRQTRVYDANTGQPAGPTLDPGGIVVEAAYSPDGASVAIAALTAQTLDERRPRIFLPDGMAGNVQIWDPRSGKRLVGPCPLPAEPRGLAFRPDGRTLAVVCADYHVVIIDTSSGAVRHRLDPGVRSKPLDANLWTSNGDARFSPDGRFLVTWELAHALHIWDPDRGRLLQTLDHTGRIENVAFNPVANYIFASGGRDSVVKVWDITTGRLLTQLQHPQWIQGIAFSNDGNELITSCSDGLVRAWNWRIREMIGGSSHHPSTIGFEFAENGRYLITTGVHSLDATDWRGGSSITPVWQFPDRIQWGIKIPAGDRRAIVGGFNGTLIGFDLETMLKPATSTTEDLKSLAELVAGRRILSKGNVVALDSAEWKNRWEQHERVANQPLSKP
jgi:eukaryotic-like serine/threonine-protein kinase